MYHQIDENPTDDLTVTPQNLEAQFRYLAEKGYTAAFFKDLSVPKRRTVMITFDDGYLNNYIFLPPLLKKYGLKATLFIPTQFTEEKFYNGTPTMDFEQLKSLDTALFEIGLHSHSHPNFSKIALDEARSEIERNMLELSKNGIAFSPVFAYPYGRYPQGRHLEQILFNLKIKYAVRIGNGINYFPFRNPYKILRIDVKSRDTMARFRKKLIFGKLRLF